MSTKDAPSTEPGYRIGAVSRLTGISTDTLRMWERRYGVVEPHRAEKGNRLYTRDDISRLALIKRLVDAGHAIGTIANLSQEQLQERLGPYAEGAGLSAPGEAASCRVAVLGDALAVRLPGMSAELEGLDLVGLYRERRRFEEEVVSLKPDVVILEYPTVHEDTVTEVKRLARRSAARALVVYGFATAAAARQLRSSRILPVRAPVDASELRRLCLGGRVEVSEAPEPAGDLLGGPVPPRRYDDGELARIAMSSTTVKCECPHHLSDLVSGLAAFETYSAQCESRHPDDAALHAYLHATTARARAMIEDALARVVESEGIEV